MAAPSAPLHVLLLCQNIGSIECNTKEVSTANQEMTLQWTRSVADFLKREEERFHAAVDVLVIHLQEIGGKKFNGAFNDYLRTVMPRCYPEAAWCSGLMGPAQDDATTFTAMGSILFLSQRVVNLASIWSFEKKRFVSISNWNNHEAKDGFYASSKFSNAGTSRKGYLLTTLRIGESRPINFVNLHLLHDADNSIAASQPHPSEYVLKRAEAMAETISAAPFSGSQDPIFLFGDFNLRLDTHSLKRILEDKFQQVIQLEKKKVLASDGVWEFLQDSQNWPILRALDKDAGFIQNYCRDKTGFGLHESPLEFGPTYLLEDDPAKCILNSANDGIDKSNGVHGNDPALTACYKRHSRFLAWADRIWFNEAGKDLLKEKNVAYWTSSLHTMDHLPVYLRFSL